MSDLDVNLSAGLEAVRFVKGQMKLGAKNKLADLWRSKGNSATCVNDLRSDVIKQEGQLMDLYQSSPNAAVERIIEFTASAAASYGCGNCHEQAALAFIYLRDKNIYPIDLVEKADFILSFGGHTFVLLGRKEGSNIGQPSSWGEFAVVVDPHERETAYPAAKIEQYMATNKLSSIFRLKEKSDTAIRVAF